MSVSLNLNLSGTLPGFFLAAENGTRGHALKQAIGGAVQREVQDHLRRQDSSRPNQLGGVRTHFYGDAAQATFFAVANDGATVTVAQQGFRQRVEGGTIRPVRTKWLAIPARAEAYGKRPGEFSGQLDFVPVRADLALLVARDGTRGTRLTTNAKGKRVRKTGNVEAGLVMYWLKKEVNQAPDPTLVPTEARFKVVIAGATADWLNTIGARP